MNVHEKWYDEAIAPRLAEIASLCQNKGCAFVAVVEYAPGKRGSTLLTPKGSGLAMMLLRALDNAGENIDAFMISVLRFCREKKIDTSSSIFLNYAGREERNATGTQPK